MSSPKERKKARRRAEKQMDLAGEALAADDLVLALKLSHRAIALGGVNPRLWLDHGRILVAAGKPAEAAEAFRQAIALAPTYGEAFVELARLQAGLGKVAQAVRLQSRAVELLPGDAVVAAALAGYRSLRPAEAEAPAAAAVDPPPELTERTGRYDWAAIDAELKATGMARLPALLDPAECAELIAMWPVPDTFEHEVTRDDATGRVCYRFFTRPLPELVGSLRVEIYGQLAPIANAWNAAVRRADRYPGTLEAFVARCHDAGQTRTTPILLRYPPGGFNGAHRDVAGRVVFPFQLAVTLGPGCTDADGGGELCMIDERPGKKLRERRLGSGVGDGIVFCTRERPVQVAGVRGLQPVLHGVSPVAERERFALGVPFHEHG